MNNSNFFDSSSNFSSKISKVSICTRSWNIFSTSYRFFIFGGSAKRPASTILEFRIKETSCGIHVLFLCIVSTWSWNFARFLRIIYFTLFNFCTWNIWHIWYNKCTCVIKCIKLIIMTWSWIIFIWFFKSFKFGMN